MGLQQEFSAILLLEQNQDEKESLKLQHRKKIKAAN